MKLIAETPGSDYRRDYDYGVVDSYGDCPKCNDKGGIPAGGTTAFLDDPLLYGAAHDFGVVLEVEFLQNACAVSTDRGRSEMHALGDFRDGLP